MQQQQDDNNKHDEILIQITCKFSIDNQRNGYFDLPNDAKLENFNNQLLYKEDESTDKIFHETVEEQNLAKLYLNGYDVTFVKYGKKNVFYEGEDEPTDKTDESTSSSEDSDDSESEEFQGGIVQKFIRTIFEELVSAKNLNYIFSIGWTEINEQNQLLDLLNGNGLIQCFSLPQLMEMLTVGLSNRNRTNTHNILSIVLEQQWLNEVTGHPQMKLSTVNFCDLIYGTVVNNFISEPRDLPMNFYSQPVPQLPPYAYMMPSLNGNYFSPPPAPPDFGFFNNNMRTCFDPSTMVAQQQNNKLLKNAEILFSKLNLNEMNEAQRKEIQEWMYLKTECDNFMPTPEVAPELPPSYFGNMNAVVPPPPPPAPIPTQQPTPLLPIIEMDETNDLEEDETNENESDCGSYIDINDHSNNLFTKISDKMTSFRDKSDELVSQKSTEYFENNPKVLSSGQSDAKVVEHLDEASGGSDLKLSTNTSMNEEQYLAKSGRRRSIRDNNILNSDELNLIRKAAAATSLDHELVKESDENENLSKLDEMRRMLKKSLASIDSTKDQIKEVEQTIALKKNLITDLVKNSKTRMTAKSKCNKKKTKYQSEYEKTKKELSKAILAGKSSKEIQRLKDLTAKFEEKLLDLTGINEIAGESSFKKKIEQLRKSLDQSKELLESLNKKLKKEVKQKESIEKDIAKQVKLIEGENENNDSNKKLVAASPSPSSATGSKISEGKVKIRDVNARISHLDEILKEKSSNLQLFGVTGSPGEDKDVKEKESLRYEIRNLRRTRDTLLDQRVSLYKKLKRDKMLTYKEERKMLECDEAIMAIDDVIEVKNELICGHKSIDTDEKLEREKGEQLLMARLNKLSQEEMRILLYKYFMKVIDLKESCKKLEQTLMSLERDKEAWEWREKILRNAIRQERLESERNLVIQQKNHETRLNLLLRHFANETANSSLNESNFDTSSNSGAAALPDYEELNIVKATKSRHQYQQHAQMHHQTEINRDFKKNLFTKFHVLTRYHQQGGGPSAPMPMSNKEALMIPQENLKQLTEKKPATKVTRQKNKLIIQKNDKN